MSNNFLGLENTAISKNSTDCILNLLQLNLMGTGSTGNQSAVGGNNSNNSQQNNGRIGGDIFGNNKQHQIQQQSAFYQSSGGGNGGGGGGGGGSIGIPIQKSNLTSGRAITNTGNLGNNFDIFSQSNMGIGGKSNNDITSPGGDFKNLRIGGPDNNMIHQGKQYRNGDGKCLFVYYFLFC